MLKPWIYDKRFKEKPTGIKQLWEIHSEMIRMIVLGQSNDEIGEQTGYRSNTVSLIRNSPLVRERVEVFKNALDARTLDIAKRIQETAPKALKLLEEIIEGKVEVPVAIRAKYASEHLDRAGYGPLRKTVSLNGQISKEDMDRIKERALNAARESGIVEKEPEMIEMVKEG